MEKCSELNSVSKIPAKQKSLQEEGCWPDRQTILFDLLRNILSKAKAIDSLFWRQPCSYSGRDTHNSFTPRTCYSWQAPGHHGCEQQRLVLKYEAGGQFLCRW